MPDADINLVSLMQEPRFRDPLAAAEYLEGIRWPDGPVCPHCGNPDKHYRLKNQTRRLWKCAKCRKQFTVTVGTIFESSHVGLDKWLLAFYLLCTSKGMSAHQLHRMLGVTYKTAWFIFRRVREAMRDPAFQSQLTGVVEADEAYIGGKRSAGHETVNHGEGEYLRGAVHTNTIEGYFATLKRGVNGGYHRVSPAPLHRHLNEFDFRYNTRDATDGGRMVAALKQTEGKRLMYRDSR